MKSNDPRSCERNSTERGLRKSSGLQRGLYRPWPHDADKMLYRQLNYEATDVGSWSFVGSYVPVNEEMNVNEINHMWTADIKWNEKLVSQSTQNSNRGVIGFFFRVCLCHCRKNCIISFISRDSQFPYRGNNMIFWIFRVVLCRAFCIWHWPIGKDLDLSFIWGHRHHLHLVGMMISWSADYFITCYTVLTRLNKVETAVHGCNSCSPAALGTYLALSSIQCFLMDSWQVHCP